MYVFESQESFVRLTGSNLLGSVSTTVVFDGPIRAENEPSNATSSSLDVWLPTAVSINAGQYSVSVVANDGTGTRTIGPVTFNVIERASTGQPPQFTIPEVVVGEAENSTGGTVTFDDGGSSCTRSSGSFFAMGTTSVTCSASNEFGTTSITFTVVVTDTILPVITVPDDITQSDPVVTYSVSATDNIDGTITSSTGVPFVSCFPASGATFPTGDTIVQCRASDRHFNFATATFKVTILSNSPPTLFLPANIEDVQATGPGTEIFYTVTASDGTISCSPPSGSLFAVGVTTVNCTATNNVGSTSGSFTVEIVDTLGPALVVPDDMIVEATGPSGATVNFTTSAVDLVDGNRTVTCSPASGSTFPLGTTLVQCSSTDTRNNSSHDSFSVTVRDTTPPAITTPSSPYHVEATSASGAVVNYTASATDLVDGARTVNCTPASGFSLALNASQVVTCTSSDTRGNTATATFTAEVSDRTAPTIVSIDGSPREIIWPPNHKMIPIQVIVVANDAVDSTPFAHIISVTSSQPEQCNCGDGDTAPDWNITSDLTVEVRAERTNGQDRTYTITVEVIDDSGNASQGTLTILVHP